MACKKCGGKHDTEEHFKVVEKLNDKGFPVHDKRYKSAHAGANRAEKAKFPKGYEEMKKIDRKEGRHELVGKNSKSGKIEVEKKVPKRLREEVAYHEETENKTLRKKR